MQAIPASKRHLGLRSVPRHAFIIVEDPAESADTFSGDSLVIVEPRLRDFFECARPSPEYATLLEELPEVFVGRAAQLEVLVALVASALQASFVSSGLPLPPWRTKEALLAHWNLDATVDGLPDPATLRRWGGAAPPASSPPPFVVAGKAANVCAGGFSEEVAVAAGGASPHHPQQQQQVADCERTLMVPVFRPTPMGQRRG